MEENPTNQSSQQTQPEENRSPVPNGTGKGLFGILFIGIVIFSMFLFLILVLNYFNIIPLSNSFPNYLSFLPHRPLEQSQNKETTRVKQGFPTQIPSLTEEAKQALIKYLPAILERSFVPLASNISFKQDVLDKQKLKASWLTKDGTASAAFILNVDSHKIYQLQVGLPFENDKIASIDLAKKTISQFFSIQPKGVWGCGTLSNGANYCESFWEEENGDKQGIGFAGALPKATNNNISSVIYCYHNKQSSLHLWKSCNAEFYKTGVQ